MEDPVETAGTGRFDLNTVTVGELLDDPEALAVITELLPDLPANPMVGMVRGMPFNSVVAMAAGQVDPATVAALKERLAAL